MLAFVDPKGTAIELFAACRELDAGDPLAGIGPMKLGHVAFGVTDPEKMVAFYTGVLGFRELPFFELEDRAQAATPTVAFQAPQP